MESPTPNSHHLRRAGMGPGIGRAIVGLIIGFVAAIAVLAILRIGLTLAGLLGQTEPILPGSGTILFFGGFGGLFGWLWGIGSLIPASHEHMGLEHYAAEERVTPIQRILASISSARPQLRTIVAPLYRPLIVAFGVCVIMAIGFMLLGVANTPLTKVQTENPAANATTLQGNINLPFNDAQGNPMTVNKTVFFFGLVVVILGILGGFALVLTLLMNALGGQVQKAKKSPDEPPKEENGLFRLIDFFVTWIRDILSGTEQSITH